MRSLALVLTVVTLLAVACGPAEPTPDIEATVAAAVEGTRLAAPTATEPPVPSDTPPPTPTATMQPTATATTAPMETPVPSPTATAAEVPLTASGTISTTLKNGWVQYELSDAGFSLALPPTWVAIDLAAADLGQMLQIMGDLNPNLANLLSTDVMSSLLEAGMVLYAIDTAPDSLLSGGITNLNLLVTELPIELTLDSYAAINIGQLESLFPDLIMESERVELGGREAERLLYTAEMTALFGPAPMQFDQYLSLDGMTVYVLTLTTPTELAESYAPIFEEIAASVQFLDSGE